MIQDYSISKCTRKCAISGEDLAPGEVYYSVIVPKSDDLLRIDISKQQWNGPQEEAVGWWKCRMPEAGVKKLKPAPNGILLDTLSELVERPGKESLAYFLSLLLVRRRILSETEVVELDSDDDESGNAAQLSGEIDQSSSEGEQEFGEDAMGAVVWPLVCSADGRQWNVPVCEPTAEQLGQLEEELNLLLFTEE